MYPLNYFQIFALLQDLTWTMSMSCENIIGFYTFIVTESAALGILNAKWMSFGIVKHGEKSTSNTTKDTMSIGSQWQA